MQTYFILILSFYFSLSFSQIEKDYDIYLWLSSEKKEMRLATYSADTVSVKIYTIEKKRVTNKRPTRKLSINAKGELNRNIIAQMGNPQSCCSAQLAYNTIEQEIKKVSKNEIKNKLTYDDLIESKFENFLKILLDAKKVYVIDTSNEEENDEEHYKAYEVTVNSFHSID
jgi:pyoverdine/dityrosine biosynthesis protein Dit1